MTRDIADDTGIGVESYVSVERETETEVVIKKSRFIAKVRPVGSVDDAEAWLAQLRTEFADATHVCFAYRIGLETTTSKMSDDGEPKGTAGRPILEVLERREVENVALAVIRYYGGTPLGAGGLIRAYAGSAREVLDEAAIVRYTMHRNVQVRLDYGDWAKIEPVFPTWGGRVVDVHYEERIVVQAAVSLDDWDHFVTALTDATAGRVDIEEGDVDFYPETPSQSVTAPS